ncbi:RIP metalloprotease RseP [Candidatus Falkowbacteria bacterium]|uniref:Zinc metalloprotease n=1 Tax=Candidatus Falkowbacteria bacterium CG10_big_fil_rev_8_21_14_0_10_37_18 TaxID=1974562 RepID=A0A2H0V8T6_9BACT|nr:RIP metalloprotease RseP [Candidatus Falkowbacteria bacterium]NCQ12607.1 RIP metalloprotease RseP [Candidatus Falkowbacteria bacterium]OIO05566.1 MAG: RIP metalloprotease RseP [Candidatus Falkowbacteria bacterium CG1_02_37_21]PIR95495.1 MAG: RIP metalloprotease RseP [Candidatus Falkowbacteria bacterium CG10_big_fil_rev_8_21_14_0_10_37_18]
MSFTAIIFIVVLSILVLAHEYGHFFVARRFGVKAEEFGLGFPPRAIGWYKNKKGKWLMITGSRSVESLVTSNKEEEQPAPQATVYSLNWLPLGGFVKIKGENGEGENDTDSFVAKSIGRRVLILTAGVFMNIVLAWFLLSVGYVIGLPQSMDTLGSNATLSDSQVIIAQVLPDSIAAKAGLEMGDVIMSVNGSLVTTEKNLQDLVANSNGQEANLLVERNNKEQTITVVPQASEGERAVIGVAIFSSGLVSYPFFSAFWEGARTTAWILGQIFVAFYDLFLSIFQGAAVGDQFAGPVGIATITGQAARLGFSHLLQFMALLSLNLAVLNIIPFPALDGGRVLFLLIEKIKGSPVRREVEAIFHNIGFLLLIALVIFITYRDIIKIF